MQRKLVALLAAIVMVATGVAPSFAAAPPTAPAAPVVQSVTTPAPAAEPSTPSILPDSPTDSTKVPHYFGPYSNWANSPQVMVDAIVDITGGGGTGATAVAAVNPKTGGITGVTVTSPGSGYTSAPAVAISSAGGTATAASATAVISSGVIKSITVNETGFAFTTPTVTLTGGFAGGAPVAPDAAATAIASGGVDSVAIVDGGGPYTTQAIVTFDLPDQPGGVQATGTATFDATSGAITAVDVVDAGSGYSFAPGLTIRDAGQTPVAVPAVVTATINVTQVALTSGGQGYDSVPTVAITDVGGVDKGASATALIAAKGAVTDINVTAAGAGYLTPGIRKFVDTLAGIDPTKPNDLGAYISVGEPDKATYPGADYYEIGVVQYRHQFHKDLPPTLLRGYVQLSTSVVPGKHLALFNESFDPTGTPAPVFLPDGTTRVYAVDDPSYLGPTIVASKDRPVRILFRNLLPTGVDGNLFLPVDTTLMGSGMGPDMIQLDPATKVPKDLVQDNSSVMDGVRNPECGLDSKMGCFTEDRATLHLHGGVTPWISDGTPHQWITPANDGASYPQGVSVSNVPDMPDPGPGAQTFFYTNQQSARLMFYHDHAWGITRLNVYAGEAAAYLVTDATEAALTGSGGALEGLGIGTPLIIQDKTFVSDNVLTTDPTWDKSRWGGTGSLWTPHVYMPAQNPGDPSGMSTFGRWMYGPWFWPPAKDAKYPAIPNPYFDANCKLDDPLTWQYQSDPFCEPAQIPGTPNISVGMEAFNDTPIVNGTAYPKTTVDPKAYRFRILNAANDRFWNLQWYVADPTTGTLSEVALKPAEVAAAQLDVNVFPTPDTTKSPAGPDWVQIGTEGGFLPAPVVVPNQPITWITDPTRFDVGNVDQHSLLLAPAERADVVVDFSAYRGKTLILYNDAPAAFPARVGCYDYYTGGPDLTPACAPSTLPGYGPNTRTIMQVKVSTAAPALAWDRPNTANDRMGALVAAFKHHADGSGVFESGSDPIIVGQAAYNDVYGTSFASGAWCNAPTSPSAKCDGFARIQEGSQPTDLFKFDTLNGAQLQIPFQPKGMHDEMNSASFDEFGRMTANLGLEAPGATPLLQNIILYPYVNPATEILDSTNMPSALDVTPISSAADGTQIWKITHNGVDTHPIHFHLYDVQVLNRVTWDNIIIPPDATELGWKETVRISPLEDTIVALRPIVPTLPFAVPDSRRPLNPAMPIGAKGDLNALNGQQAGFNNTDTNGNPMAEPIENAVTDFNWEYVFHCHILSHEEMDMMRPVTVLVPSVVPDPVVQLPTTPGSIVLHWTDATPVDYLDPTTWGSKQQEIRFEIWRSDVATPAWPADYTQVDTALANATTWHDTTGVGGQLYSYVVVAVNEAGPSLASNVQSAVFGLDVTASSHALVFGDPVPPITYTYSPTTPTPATNPVCTTTYNQGDPIGTYATSCAGIVTLDPVYGTSINYIPGTITVGPKPLTVSGGTYSVAFGDPVPSLAPIYAGLVPPALAPATPATCTTAYTNTSSVAGSPYAITCSGAADPNYTFTYVDGSIAVARAAVVVSTANVTVTYGGAVPTITPIYTPNVTPATPATCTTDYTQGAPVAGPYTITCSGAADPNYTFTYNPGTFTVNPAAVVVSTANVTVTYGGAVPTITPIYTPNVTPATPATCTTDYTQGAPVAGPYTITCSGAADPNYTFTYNPGTFTVNPAAVVVSTANVTVTYGGAVPTITPIYTPNVTPATPATCTTDYTQGAPVAGPYTITCSGAADPNATFTYAPGTFTVSRAAVVVTGPTRAVTFGDPVPSLTPTYVPAITPATPAVCTTTYRNTSSVAGSPYAITCSGAADPNHSFTFVSGSITVARATLRITASSGTMVYHGTVPTIVPIYTGLRAGNLATATPPTCSTSATATSNVGTYASTCLGAADPNYAITYAPGTVTVARAPQTITFPAQANRTWGTFGFSISATATSGLPVTFTSATPATCAVGGSVVLLVAPGTCTITATQAGSTNWLAAAPVTRSLSILKAVATTAIVAAFNPTKVGATARFTVTVSSPLAGTPTGNVQLVVDGVYLGAPVALSATGVATIQTTAIAAGTHTVAARYAGDAFFLASMSPALSYQVVARLSTTTAVTSSVNPSVWGQPVTFTATVTRQNASLGTLPGGTVQFTNGGVNVGTARPVDATGKATLTIASLAVGAGSIRAVYSGDTSYAGSTSTAITQTVNRAATAITLTLTTPVSRRNTNTYRATVVAVAPGVGTVTGTVRFYRNGTQFGSATLSGGVATLSYRSTTQATGTFTMTAGYVASTNFAASTSPGKSQRITN